jgi:hypothetical protein
MKALADPTVTDEAGSPAIEQPADELMDGAEASDGTVAEAEVRETAGDTEVPTPTAPAIPPLPPIAAAKRAVRGRYRSGGAVWQLELRVDVGGTRPMRRVSGDFFSTSGATTSYFGSFAVHNPTITTTAAQVRIEGEATFTWAARARRVRVTIPRVIPPQAQGAATVQFITPPSTISSTYRCDFASRFFRTVQWEQDSVAGTVPFVSYDTGLLPQPPDSPARVLSVPAAYAEAGIELQTAGTPNVVPVTLSGSDRKWNDSELHNAMVNHFSLFADRPQWRVWLLVATRHEGPFRGIMFDSTGPFQRQGAAVFFDEIQGTDPASQRAQLRTYVHELGHAFNLLHSWQKNLADPPAPLGPNQGLGDLSWMNYVQNFQPPPPAPGGEAAYWAAFPFQFTDNEVVHLRHGFYKDVIMGANAFGTGAAEVDPDIFDEPVVDNSGLALELRGRDTFAYGEPVVVELKLSTTDLRGRETNGYLHPRDDVTTIAIRQPSGRTIVYRPILRHCIDEERSVRLDQARPAIYESAYIGYGQDGFCFEQPGTYSLRAQYLASDGSRVISQVMKLRVRAPASKDDERAGELLLGDEQGQLLALLGSRSESLRGGNEALETLLIEYGEHPFSVYARLAKGVNAQRDFKDLTPDKELTIHPAEPKDSIHLLSAVEKASKGDDGVDNITLNMAMRTQARAEAKAGNLQKADAVLDRMVGIFEKKELNPRVIQHVRDQAEDTKRSIAAEMGEDEEE